MLRTAIIDDELDSIETLASLIELYKIDAIITGTAHTVKGGVEMLNKTNPDLVFLDVRLKEELCFSIFEHIPSPAFQIIFISAYDEYVFRAFKYSAVDFLLKPIDPEELEHAVRRAKENIAIKSNSVARMEVLLDNFKAVRPFRLSLSTSDGLEFVNINDIICIKAEGSYSVLSFKRKSDMMVSRNIGEFEDQLPADEFCRVHYSHIVNLNYVKKLRRKGGLAAEMPEGKTIPIARNRKDKFMKKLDGLLIGK